MDSGDLEREKGITILAKNTAVHLARTRRSTSSTPPGTPTSVARSSADSPWSTACCCSVDAAEGPLPQTRFVLRKTLERRLPVIVVVNKVDRPDARPAEVIHEIEELFLDLDADEHQISFPVLYASSREGWATHDRRTAPRPTSPSCSRRSATTCPPPQVDEGAPLRALVCNLDASPYVGRLALLRVVSGTLERGQHVAWCRLDGSDRARASSPSCTSPRRSSACPRSPAGPGDIVAIAGIEEITIGETLADLDDPAAARRRSGSTSRASR